MANYIYSPENFERDKTLLNYVDTLQVKEHYVNIHLFNPYTGKDIGDIEGIVTQGSVSVNGNSIVRRTGSLTLIVPDEKIFGIQYDSYTIHKVTDLNNLIAINKRARIYVGYSNTGNQYPQYDMFWFPLGTFVLQNPSVTYNTSGIQVQVKLSDLMTLLNGTDGGELQTAMTHSPLGIVQSDGTVTDDPVLVKEIITTLVSEMGSISQMQIDIPTELTNQIIRWGNSSNSAYVYTGADEKTHISLTLPSDITAYDIIKYGEPLGTKTVDFTYPGELKSNPGEAISSVLDKIKKTLGNYEFFFDINGNFIFQKIKNYLDEGAAPDDLTAALNEKYFYKVENKAVLSLENSKIITSYSNTPKFDAVKNDFVVWGKDDDKLGIRYHLLIDKYSDKDDLKSYDCQYYTDSLGTMRVLTATEIGVDEEAEYIKITARDWRHQLYLSAIAKNNVGLTQLDKEIIEEFPKIFDVIGNGGYFYSSEPFLLPYWLDRINVNDLVAEENVTDVIIQQMAISDIGDRPKTYNDDKLNCLFMPKTPNVNLDEDNVKLEDGVEESLAIGTSYNPALDYLRSVLHEHTSANNSISLSILPMYYLEPNMRIEVENDESDIHGEYIINSLTMPLTVNDTMTIQASKAVERI